MKKKKFIFLLGVIVFVSTVWVGVAQAQPKNVIFFIGDGMGPEHVKAARYYAGSALSFESFPYDGEVTTYSADHGGANPGATDSAAAGTALATGVKVNNGVVSMAYPGDHSELETLLEYYKELGKSTGLVTTTFMTHATPATFGAHEPSRDNLDEIADDYRLQTQPNVLFGGGANGMTIAEFENAGYTVKTCWDVGRDGIPDDDGLKWVDTEAETMVSGQFGSTHLPYEPDVEDLPHLSEMTYTALRILDNDPDGFFLMVEGGLIDKASHRAKNEPIYTHKMILEMVEFDNAVQEAIDWAAGRTDTLILVTADHETGGLTVISDNGQGNDPTVTWETTGHTDTDVPVYSWGVNSEMIYTTMDNTDMFGVCTADPAFYVKDASGEAVAWFGNLGNLWLKGNFTSGGTCTAPSGSFIIASSTDPTVAYIDNEGNMCIEGTLSEQSGSCNPPGDAFIIRNSSGDNVSYIDFANGDLCLTGKLY